jgi:hypothetical protein
LLFSVAAGKPQPLACNKADPDDSFVPDYFSHIRFNLSRFKASH